MKRVIRVARLDLPVDVLAIRADLDGLPDHWSPHFQRVHHNGGWAVLPLRSVGGAMGAEPPFALGDESVGHSATPLLEECPAVSRFLDSLGCPLLSARLLKLRPGAEIKPHRDIELASEYGEARLHVPIVTNPFVEFTVDDMRVPMEAGTCWYVNANLTHRVLNRGDGDRIHLVVDCVVDDWLRDRFAEAAAWYTEVRRPPDELRQMIASLREMDLPASPALIAELEEELADAD